nr:SPASM domain-containing protein [Candidatus Cloacimonadota bacterium]
SWKTIKQNIDSILNSKIEKKVSIHITDIMNFTNSNPDLIKQSHEKLKNLFCRSDKLFFHKRVFHNATGHLSLNKKKSIKQHICPHPWASLVIASNGDIVACSRDIMHKTTLGNVFNMSITDIFQSSHYQNFREFHRHQKLDSLKACKNCDLPNDSGKMNFKHFIYTFINRLGGLKA